MDSSRDAFPNDINALKAALIAARDECAIEAIRAAHAEAELAVARARASDDQALIAHQQLRISFSMQVQKRLARAAQENSTTRARFS